jgi:1,4-alpha-glucan branching enzyme
MKILMLSRRFTDGEGVSEYCKHLSGHLVEQGHEVSIVAFEDGTEYNVHEEVDVRRVPLHFEGDSIYNWAMMLNNEIKRVAREIEDSDSIDLIHANDWATIPGGVTLAKSLEKPLVVTIHSTENERGFEGEHAAMISELEWQGTFEAEKVFVTKEETKNSVLFDLDVPGEKVEVIDPLEEGWQSRIEEKYEETLKQEEKVLNNR